MPKIEVFDPAMCCSTGVCGPKVDTSEWLPLILADGRIVSEKTYPTREALASLAGVALVEG
jgi:hypothetical protein